MVFSRVQGLLNNGWLRFTCGLVMVEGTALFYTLELYTPRPFIRQESVNVHRPFPEADYLASEYHRLHQFVNYACMASLTSCLVPKSSNPGSAHICCAKNLPQMRTVSRLHLVLPSVSSWTAPLSIANTATEFTAKTRLTCQEQYVDFVPRAVSPGNKDSEAFQCLWQC